MPADMAFLIMLMLARTVTASKMCIRDRVSTSSPGWVTARMAWAIAPAAPVVGKMCFCA